MDPVIPLTTEETEQAAQKALHHNYFMRVLHQIDELGAALADQPIDTTISSDEGIAALKDHGFVGEQAKIVAEILNWVQRNHCAKATAGDWAQALEVAKRAETSGIINQDKK